MDGSDAMILLIDKKAKWRERLEKYADSLPLNVYRAYFLYPFLIKMKIDPTHTASFFFPLGYWLKIFHPSIVISTNPVRYTFKDVFLNKDGKKVILDFLTGGEIRNEKTSPFLIGAGTISRTRDTPYCT